MSRDLWNAIENMFSKHPVMKAGPVGYEEIDTAAHAAGIKLPEDYREFIHRYGGAFVGPLPIIGLRKAPVMARSESSVFEVTARFRQEGWQAVEDWLIISVDQAGNPIGFDKEGKVWINDHHTGVIEPIAEDFEDFLRKRCLK